MRSTTKSVLSQRPRDQQSATLADFSGVASPADRKRNKPAFRALTRLARAGALQLHIPGYVKGEVLSQQQRDVRDQIGKMKAAAKELMRTTGAANMLANAEEVVKLAADMGTQVEDSVKTELQELDRGGESQRTSRAWRSRRAGRVGILRWVRTIPSGQQDDPPDAFIRGTALDLVEKHGRLIVISDKTGDFVRQRRDRRGS